MEKLLDNSIKWYYGVLKIVKEKRLSGTDDGNYGMLKRKQIHKENTVLFEVDVEMANYLFGLKVGLLKNDYYFSLLIHLSHINFENIDFLIRKLKLYKIKINNHDTTTKNY